MYGLQGKKAIVTGAAHGIGKAIAARLAAEGCEVGIFDLDKAAAEATGRAITASGGKAFVASGDVSSKPDVVAGVAALTKALGQVDILVNNAGICKVGKILETSEEDWYATFGINVNGMFHMIRQVAPGMMQRRSGAVVNLASWMGKSGVAAYGAYQARIACLRRI